MRLEGPGAGAEEAAGLDGEVEEGAGVDTAGLGLGLGLGFGLSLGLFSGMSSSLG